jgi:hypothetical protein|tara:strand:+ start:342 stop:887 length:546 start_codon:yes stop_codon:yes gene_type:complete
MALWGNKDTVYSTGNVTHVVSTGDDAVITFSGSTFTNPHTGPSSGQVVGLGTFGGGVIKSVDSDTQLTLHGTAGIRADVAGASGKTYNISEAPKFIALDSDINVNEVYGSDNDEVGVAATTIYSHDHAGWVGIVTYTDTHGNVRTKTEVLVAMGADADGNGGITGDAGPSGAGDDAILADS